jgi:hypothetical protein
MKNSNQALLRHPRPYADEDLAGYILRMCQSNGYDSPQWIYPWLEFPNIPPMGTSSIERLAIYLN